ncbi:MAG: branched-chain amino acid transaminase [Planctomycetes bacterium]|nr:branched-chain amino acid transaminase [Planctomycetota bacterium]
MYQGKAIWMNGELVPWSEAKVHVLTHSLHYGLAAFEGIRCYKAKGGSAVFRLEEHLERFRNSMKLYTFDIPYTTAQLVDAIRATIRENGLEECYVRPLAYLGAQEVGVYGKKNKVEVAIAVWPWGAYLGEEGLTRGVRIKTSSWARVHPNTMMTHAKISGNYVNGQLAKMEAIADGFDEALLLDVNGCVAEGGGENIFIVRRGVLKTPPTLCILPGITRDTIIELGRTNGCTVLEQPFTRDEIFLADEAFFVGTATEVTPIRELDRRTVGEGRRGPITKDLQDRYFAIVRGENPAYEKWLTRVTPAAVPKGSPAPAGKGRRNGAARQRGPADAALGAGR